MIEEGKTYMINDSVLGEVTVVVTVIRGNNIGYDNKMIRYSGMCHIEHFEKMLVR